MFPTLALKQQAVREFYEQRAKQQANLQIQNNNQNIIQNYKINKLELYQREEEINNLKLINKYKLNTECKLKAKSKPINKKLDAELEQLIYLSLYKEYEHERHLKYYETHKEKRLTAIANYQSQERYQEWRKKFNTSDKQKQYMRDYMKEQRKNGKYKRTEEQKLKRRKQPIIIDRTQ